MLRSARDPPGIAVVGMGCWFAGCQNPREYWENILAQRCEFRRLPPQRISLQDYYCQDTSRLETFYQPKASLIDGFVFDRHRFGVSQETFEVTDIAQWLSLTVAVQAMDDIQSSQDHIPRSTAAVFVGNMSLGEQTRSLNLMFRWPFFRRALQTAMQVHHVPPALKKRLEAATHQAFMSAFPHLHPHVAVGHMAASLATRLCHTLDFHGGAYTIDGACASALIAVAQGCAALQNHRIDFALAGGVEVQLDPFELTAFARAGAMSATHIQPLDAHADGTIQGEGCGFVALKRLWDAQRDGDAIYAILHGWGLSSDGKGSLMRPCVASQRDALLRAYAQAPYPISDLDFIEAHGAATPKGDTLELTSLTEALQNHPTPPHLQPQRFYALTTAKSILGHTQAAAGIAGLIKAIMAVNRRIIPATARCRQPHGLFLSETSPLYPALEAEIKDPTATLRAGVNAFGFGGINAHITLASGPCPDPRIQPTFCDEAALAASYQDAEVFLFAAVSPDALRHQIQSVACALPHASTGDLTDLAAYLFHVLAQKPPAHPVLRAGVVATSPEDFQARLDLLLEELQPRSTRPPAASGPKDPFLWRTWALEDMDPSKPIDLVFFRPIHPCLKMIRLVYQRFAWARALVEDLALRLQAGPEIKAFLYLNSRDFQHATRHLQDRSFFKNPSSVDAALEILTRLYETFLRQCHIHAVGRIHAPCHSPPSTAPSGFLTHGIAIETDQASWVNLLQALAYAHAKGVEVDMRPVFEGRLIRPYRPPSQRIFIDNLCEKPMGIA